MVPQLDVETRVPLVVDLDGTLVLTDTLHEAFAALLFRRPLVAARSLLLITKGPAVVKRFLAEHSLLTADKLPRRLELLALLRAEKARGRPLHLVTAADQAVADRFAADLGLFESATGSDGLRNMKGMEKLAALRQRFADGFLFAGVSAADLPIFAASRGAILCNANPATAAAVASAGIPVLADLRNDSNPVRAWAGALRPHQWSKNLLIFVPLVVGHAYAETANILAVALGFTILCALASATYMINDIADVDADRLHPTKRNRAFASGSLPIATGLVTAPLLMFGALAAGFALSTAFGITLLAYLALTTAYSFGLKQVPLLDVFVIGALFTLRIVMGTAVLGLGHSPWLLSFAMFFFFSLALAKRHVEVMSAAGAASMAGRSYKGDDWPLTLTFGIGAGLASIVIMLLYMANDAAPSGFYGRLGWLYVAPAAVTIWLMRIWLLSHRMELHDDPVVFALRDWVSLGLGVVAALSFVLAL